MSEPDAAPVVLSIEGLTVTLPNGRRLFSQADLQVREGEFILLVGPSGSGKTTLLRLIADLDEATAHGPRMSGQVTVGAHERRSTAVAKASVGLVFQNHALFDELSAVGNVQFALDHRANGWPAGKDEARDALTKLGVPVPGLLSTLSGGERQRVAVARTLAQDPPIVLFDEPTTGLDPVRAREVAEQITQTHLRSRKTVMVVTHDYLPFLRHSPRFVLLDGRTGKLRTVDEPDLQAEFERQALDASPPGLMAATSQRKSEWPARCRSWLEAPGEVLFILLASVMAMAGGWRHAKWKLRYLWHYLRMVALGTTALYVAIAGVMLGFVFIFFSFAQLPYKEVMVPLLTEEFLSATGYSMFRVIVPLLIGVLMAGKCGAAVAADVGARRLTHQFDAMRSFGVAPQHYLYGGIAVAFIIGMPLLTVVGYVANWYASLTAYMMTSDNATIAVFHRNFFATVWPSDHSLPIGIGWVALKASLSGALIAALAYALGSRPKASSVDVSRDVGLTIFWASLAVLLLHSVFSFVEF
jgi:ABC-type lipoprotein export system ATPase subunit/ABC-type transporter Mla maintaining outer membrane lipid asymmetry permease subunit MlaE